MEYLLLHFSGITTCVLLMVVAAIVSSLAYWLFGRMVKNARLKNDNDVSVVVFGAVSMLYSLIVAFVMVAVWEDFEDLNGNIADQAKKLQTVKLRAIELPAAEASAINNSVDKYATTQLDFKGAHTIKGKPDASLNTLHALRLQVLASAKSGQVPGSIGDDISDDIVEVIELQNQRNSSTNAHIPPVVWFALAMGSIMVVAFSWVFRTGNVRTGYVYNMVVSSFITMCLAIIYVLDHPELGRSHLDLSPFQNVIETL